MKWLLCFGLLFATAAQADCLTNANDTRVDSCIVGSWVLDRQSLAQHWYRLLPGTEFSGAKGDLTLTFSKDNSSIWKATDLIISGRKDMMPLEIALTHIINGTANLQFSATRGVMCTKIKSLNSKVVRVLTINGNEQKSDASWPLGNQDSVVTYSCGKNEFRLKTLSERGGNPQQIDYVFHRR